MKRANGNGNRKRAQRGGIDENRLARVLPRDPRDHSREYDSDALAGLALSGVEGLPDLAQELPTTLLTVHAMFTAQHLIRELTYQWQMGLLTRGDRMMLAQLGKDIAAELEKDLS